VIEMRKNENGIIIWINIISDMGIKIGIIIAIYVIDLSKIKINNLGDIHHLKKT
jgi:hypothetical protein